MPCAWRLSITSIATLHTVSNVAIDVIDSRHAHGIAYYVYYHAEPGVTLPAPLHGPMAAGRYLDEYVLTDRGWKFSARRPKNLFQAQDVAALSIVRRA